MQMPEILGAVRAGDIAIIPKRVIEELDGLKLSSDPATAQSARAANRVLAQATGPVRYESEATHLLPPDFDLRASDNRILSVALWLRLSRVVLVTSDNNFRARARAEYIRAVSPEEYTAGLADDRENAHSRKFPP